VPQAPAGEMPGDPTLAAAGSWLDAARRRVPLLRRRFGRSHLGDAFRAVKPRTREVLARASTSPPVEFSAARVLSDGFSPYRTGSRSAPMLR
jgi:hypothetical protein